MNTSTQPMRPVSPTVELLHAMLAELPDSADAVRARRDEVQRAVASFDRARSPVAAALANCVATLRARAADVRPSVRTHPTQPRPEIMFHERETVAVPQVSAPRPARPEPTHWNAVERMLYEDVLHLFELGDQPGAMTSLERLVMLNPHAEELATFLEKNGALLRKLYEEHLGSLDRVPVPIREARQVKIPTSHANMVLDVLRLADGHRSVRDILARSGLGDVPTLCSVAHLARSGFIELA